jgi:hypothetical protein
VELLPVSKGHPPERALLAVAAGLRTLGENYLQECAAKDSWLRAAGAELVSWHLLGHLQRNKAKHAAQLFACIEGVDSLEVARRLSEARSGQPALAVLCEVELTGLPSRSGFEPGRLEREFPQLQELPGIRVEGLMTVAEPGRGRQAFFRCRELAERLARAGGQALPTLSMGMSGDFQEAIEEGSTRVRLGSLLFGERPTRPG